MVLALRILIRDPIAENPPQLSLGPASSLEDHRDSLVLAGIRSYAFILACSTAMWAVGIVLLGLWRTNRERRELLFLGLYCVANLLWCVCKLPKLAHLGLQSYLWRITYTSADLTYLFSILFVVSLTRRRIPAWLWALLAIDYFPDPILLLTVILPAHTALRLQYFLDVTLYPWITPLSLAILVAALAVAFFPFSRLAPHLRLLAALSVLWFGVDSLRLLVMISVKHTPGVPDFYVRWQASLDDLSALTTLALMNAILILLFRDQSRIVEERAVLAGELQAAAQIQRMLAPASVPTAPGFELRVAFLPMREVGGDFYLCRVLPEGRRRILIGDVSGKGTGAAMTATLLIGAASARDADSPAGLLVHLNRAFVENGLGGFVTCLCADFDPSGKVVLANAGHLAPYLDGQELAVPPSLPLGLADTGRPEEIVLRLEPRKSLVLMSDGVPEARNARRELLGFELTAAISTQSAEAIARAAQSFGQEDDITVLTLSLAPVEVAP